MAAGQDLVGVGGVRRLGRIQPIVHEPRDLQHARELVCGLRALPRADEHHAVARRRIGRHPQSAEHVELGDADAGEAGVSEPREDVRRRRLPGVVVARPAVVPRVARDRGDEYAADRQHAVHRRQRGVHVVGVLE